MENNQANYVKESLVLKLQDATLYGDKYIPTNEAKGTIEIIHGMAEHRKRYDAFASFLASQGFITYIYDQRGHGETAGTLENVGYMSDIDNFKVLVDDSRIVSEYIKQENPNLPIFVFGHSMGSFITQRFAELYGKTVNGVILCGSNYTKSALYSLGIFIARIITKSKGRNYRSKFVNNLSFGSYNKPFKPNRTDFDWLSVNEANVDKYIADEWCGAMFSVSYFMDLLRGFKDIASNYEVISPELPIYLIAGSMDPVGNLSKGVIKLEKVLKKNFIKDVSMKLYEGKRHEILNEDNKEEVYNDVLTWLEKHI
jgi:alpha-beta hydrolase superfamily lysophospholipase